MRVALFLAAFSQLILQLSSILKGEVMIAPIHENRRTIEFLPARIHVRGSFAGLIEVPIVVSRSSALDSDLGDLCLDIPGEKTLLRPMGRAYIDGGLSLAYFSTRIRETRQMPESLQICMGQRSCGMTLNYREAR